MTWQVVVNPAAGGKPDASARVETALRANGIDFTLSKSDSAPHLAELVESALADGHRRFVAVGGDGTVSVVADRLIRSGTDPLLGVLPAGSGCDFIRTFGISQRLEDAAGHLHGDSEYRVDVGLIDLANTDRHFVNVANVGVVAASVRTAERLPRSWGRRRYVPAFWMSLPSFRARDVTVTTEGRGFEGRANNVVIANAQFFGGGLNIAPKATLVDGVFDVQVFTGPKRTALSLLPKVKRGTHLAHRAVRRIVAGQVEVVTEAEWPIEADGEFVGVTPASFRVLPGALRLKI